MPQPARHSTSTHHPTLPTMTDCAGRLMAGRQQTAPPQQHQSNDNTAHPHQPGASPEPPHPDLAHSRRHHPAKAKVKFPLLNRIFSDRCLHSLNCETRGEVSGHTYSRGGKHGCRQHEQLAQQRRHCNGREVARVLEANIQHFLECEGIAFINERHDVRRSSAR